MDEHQNLTNLNEFLKLLQKGVYKEIKAIREIIQNMSNIIEKTINPSVTLVSLYDRESEKLVPFEISNLELKKEELELELDAFESENPYADIFISTTPIWIQIDSTPESFELKEKLKSLGITDAIVTPLLDESTTFMGTVTVFLYSNTKKLNEEHYLEIISNVTQSISTIISSWAADYSSFLKQQQTELIVEMSNLTLETTEVKIILNNILPKVKNRTEIESLGVFIKEFDRFALIHHTGLNDDVINYYAEPNLIVSNLSYFNTSNKIEEANFTLYPEQYGVILPIGSTNIMLGFILVISPIQENLSETNIHFLRILANQLFLTLQRKRLLDDIQQITQTSEYSSFPIILVNNKYEILYLNKQAEKTFDLNYDETIGLKLDYSLKLHKNESTQIYEKISDVITNIVKQTMKLDIEVAQIGKVDTRTFFVQLSPTINNLTGEYCVVLSLVDISEATKLQSIAEEYSNRSRMYLNVLIHDIYNILFGISGYYELLDKRGSPEENQIIQRVSNLVKRGTAIVQDIRLLSSVLDISTRAERVYVPLRMTIERVITKISEEFRDKEINIKNDIPTDIRVIAGVFLYELFLYTLSSLIQNSTREVIDIDITEEQEITEENPFIIIRIIDKEGTSPETRDEIQRALSLSPFDETVRKHLGFMIVNEIAKKYNFSVRMLETDENKWKKETVLEISMPIYVENEME